MIKISNFKFQTKHQSGARCWNSPAPKQSFWYGVSNWRSFTLVELLVIIGILIILVAIATPNLRFFQRESDLANSAEEIINILRLAQNKTLASERDNQWGVFFDITTDPHQFTLFKGVSYSQRDSNFDEIHKLPSSVEI